MLSHGKNGCGGLLRGSVVPAKFLFVLLNTLPVEDETSNALVVVWFRNGARLRITGRDTAQTERTLMRLVDTSSPDSRLHQSRKRVFPRHPCFESVLSCCLCQCCTQNSSFSQSPYFAHGRRSSWFFSVDPPAVQHVNNVHALACHTHIFLRTARSLRTLCIFMRVHTHAWLKCLKKVPVA